MSRNEKNYRENACEFLNESECEEEIDSAVVEQNDYEEN